MATSVVYQATEDPTHFIDDDGLVRPRVTMLAQNAGMRDQEIRTLQWDGFVYDELVELIYKHSR